MTAAKTGERDVQTTPIAVSVLTGADLERAESHTVAEIAGDAPSVTFSQNSDFAQLTIRGIGSNVVFAGIGSELGGVHRRRLPCPGRSWCWLISWSSSASKCFAARKARSTAGTPWAAPSISSRGHPRTRLEASARFVAGNARDVSDRSTTERSDRSRQDSGQRRHPARRARRVRQGPGPPGPPPRRRGRHRAAQQAARRLQQAQQSPRLRGRDASGSDSVDLSRRCWP